ncbi:Protein tyrosine phosphatase type IVA 1 [Mortierella polycephala]|uniref:Protein tyrosine phosphatase type IVA 1 n=1 Tax=Mortierella polycephala TaxID=41804 RepID=A0A9P6QEQ0_9FUNG|nr:Protein tyrosine phosphatase type IVA 1 [Mortierella polycephala]
MVRTASSDGASISSSITATNPTTMARLQRIPTPPRSHTMTPLGKHLTLIEPPMSKNVRFLIMDCPTDSTLPFYLAELKRYNVTDVVRCCEPTYRSDTLVASNIVVHDLAFRDGAVPPANIIKSWLQLVDKRAVKHPRNSSSSNGSSNNNFGASNSRSGSPSAFASASTSASEEEDDPQVPTVAVHCVAGLGRAPILVAVALIEFGMANLDTVEFIRARRRGCFNNSQIQYINVYKRGKVLKHPIGTGSDASPSSSSSKRGFSRMFRLKA